MIDTVTSVTTSRLPNLKHLQYLVALDKHQHFNNAAKACFVSQSTLSSAIAKLEEQLACQLIEREHKSFVFTSQGKRIVDLAQQLLLNANELVDYAKQQSNPHSGSIRIGCIPTIAPFLLTDLVHECQKHLPELDMYLREDTTENLLAQLSRGEIDTAILALPVGNHDFVEKVLGQDAFFIAGASDKVDNFLKNYDYVSLPEQSVFLLNQEHCLTEHAISACQLKDVSRINSFSASSLATLVQMTAFHQGITFLPSMAVKKGVGKGQGLSIQPMEAEVYRDIGMLWRASSQRQATFELLSERVASLLD